MPHGCENRRKEHEITYAFVTLKENDTSTFVSSGQIVSCVVELDRRYDVGYRAERLTLDILAQTTLSKRTDITSLLPLQKVSPSSACSRIIVLSRSAELQSVHCFAQRMYNELVQRKHHSSFCQL